ncbi:MAG TPA: Gfo/Idh/MocA family oxidoreductase [Vicinamibacterales bacterium]|nr:Gfo/Idh/MocA family oxidoreductase [Vicinamibacterales bacterium]
MSGSASPLRVAVVGVGHLGRHHARILADLPGARLVGVVDIDADRAREVAAQCRTAVLSDIQALPGLVDAVTVAVPTESHAAVAEPLLERGIPVLVEKPIAASVEEARRLVDLADSRGLVLAVGHTERFNPAVDAAREHLYAPRFIEGHRLGTFSPRSLDIDVIFDLMIHDLDIVLSLVDSPVERIDAVGVPVLTPKIDIANVRMKFESGCIANLTASRISRDRVRKIRIFQPDSYVSVDYAAQDLEIWRLVRRPDAPPVIEGGKQPVANEEPLRRELQDFVDAVAGRTRPRVTGQDGCRALELAERLTREMSFVGT